MNLANHLDLHGIERLRLSLLYANVLNEADTSTTDTDESDEDESTDGSTKPDDDGADDDLLPTGLAAIRLALNPQLAKQSATKAGQSKEKADHGIEGRSSANGIVSSTTSPV